MIHWVQLTRMLDSTFSSTVLKEPFGIKPLFLQHISYRYVRLLLCSVGTSLFWGELEWISTITKQVTSLSTHWVGILLNEVEICLMYVVFQNWREMENSLKFSTALFLAEMFLFLCRISYNMLMESKSRWFLNIVTLFLCSKCILVTLCVWKKEANCLKKSLIFPKKNESKPWNGTQN